MPWKNGLGTTTEIASSPADATLDTFIWRLSMARIDGAAPFSAFEGVERVLTVLEGSLELTLGAAPPITLKPDGRAVRFNGEVPASARLIPGAEINGPPAALDLNLMVRRGPLVPRITRQTIACESWLAPSADLTAIVCRSPCIRVTDERREEHLAMNDVLILEGAEQLSIRLSSDGPSVAYVAELIRLAPMGFVR